MLKLEKVTGKKIIENGVLNEKSCKTYKKSRC